MRARYRTMMEQAALSDEAKTILLKKLECPAKRKVRPVRMAVIVVCVCLLLAGTVFAATTIAGFISVDRYEFGNIRGDAYSGYRLNGGVRAIPISEFSEAVRSQSAGTKTLTFASWAEAEKFIGLNLKDNPVLEQMTHSSCSYPEMEQAAHCIVRISVADKGPKHITASAHYLGGGADTSYQPDDILISLYARIATELSTRESAYEVLYPSARELVLEQYKAAGGLDAILVQTREKETAPDIMIDGEEYYRAHYTAYFALDGIAYCIDAMGYERVNAKAERPVLGLLKQTLDAYNCNVS